MNPSYAVVSGFVDGPGRQEFRRHWLRSVARAVVAYPSMKQAYIVDHTSTLTSGQFGEYPGCSIIPVDNLGHVHQYVGAQPPRETGELCGWSASVMLGALLAYNVRADMVYVEQDVLLFGDCIGEAYRQMGDRKMIFGSNSRKGVVRGVAQSFFIVKWDFLLAFVRTYLSLWPDTDRGQRPEGKFIGIGDHHIGKVTRFDFGVDRDRPLPNPIPTTPWYAQQLTKAELADLDKKGLL